MSMSNVLAVILGGGQGTRLAPLTSQRAKPAVPIGGKFRLIDIPISNCLHSSIRRIYVLTQFMSASLHRHIYQTYKFDHLSEGFCHVLAAEQTATSQDWYQGTADAVRKQIERFDDGRTRDVLILSGDHLYRMDYAPFLEHHRDRRADVTIAVHPVAAADAPRLGILKIDDGDRVHTYAEKPDADQLDGLASDPGQPNPYLASMGIYLFRLDALREALAGNVDEDFGRQIIPAAIEQLSVSAYRFSGYWEDIGTIRSFYEANLALATRSSRFDFYEPDRPIYTRPRFLPSARAYDCHLDAVTIADGCLIDQAAIQRSVVGLRSIIGPGTEIRDSILMGADFFEAEQARADHLAKGLPAIGIGTGCRIERAIVDKNARIGDRVVVGARAPDAPDEDHEHWSLRDGVVVVKKNGILPDDYRI